jgi:hypothetical protein
MSEPRDQAAPAGRERERLARNGIRGGLGTTPEPRANEVSGCDHGGLAGRGRPAPALAAVGHLARARLHHDGVVGTGRSVTGRRAAVPVDRLSVDLDHPDQGAGRHPGTDIAPRLDRVALGIGSKEPAASRTSEPISRVTTRCRSSQRQTFIRDLGLVTMSVYASWARELDCLGSRAPGHDRLRGEGARRAAGGG